MVMLPGRFFSYLLNRVVPTKRWLDNLFEMFGESIWSTEKLPR